MLHKLIILLTLPLFLYSHPGRTDADGGHDCSTKSKNKGLCTEYHYHKDDAVEQTKKVAPKKYHQEDFQEQATTDGENEHTNASDLDIDQTVPLAEALQSDTDKLSQKEQKEQINFASNTNNLVPTHNPVNGSEETNAPSEWSLIKALCKYIRSWFKIKDEDKLTTSD